MTENRDLAIAPTPELMSDEDARWINCKLCGIGLIPHPVCNLFTIEDCWWVCDDCASVRRPDLFALMARLREMSEGDWTVRQFVLLSDSEQWDCKICDRALVHEEDGNDGIWRVFFCGSPICARCQAGTNRPAAALAAELNAIEQ